MCTDPELSKRFCEVKTDELTWERLRDVAETYERATASDARTMMVNSNGRYGRGTRAHKAPSSRHATGAARKATRQKIAEPTRRSSIANSAKLKDTHPKLARSKKQRTTATRDLETRIKRDR